MPPLFSKAGSSLKDKQALLVLLIFSVPLFFIGISNVQSWGDDYAQYIQEGKNIADGKPYYCSAYVYNDLNIGYAPPDYPPGYPLLLAPVIKVKGIAIRPLLYEIAFFLTVLLFCHFFFFRFYLNAFQAMCVAIVSVYCGCMVNLKGYVLADIPLLLFTSLYLTLRHKKPAFRGQWLILVCISVMAVLIRSQGIILIFAEAIGILLTTIKNLTQRTFNIRDLLLSKSVKVLLGFSMIYLLLTHTIFYSPNPSLQFYSALFRQSQDNFWPNLTSNLFYLSELLREILYYENYHSIAQLTIAGIQYAGLLLALTGLITSFKKIERTSLIFFLLMILLIIILPARQGLRYLLPVLPVYLLMICLGLRKIFTWTEKINWNIIAAGATIIYLALGKDNYNKIPYDVNWTPYTKEDSAAFDFLRKSVLAKELIIFTKPRALALYTGIRSMNLAWQVSASENKRKFDNVRAKYILKRDGVDDHFIKDYLREIPALDSLVIGKNHTLYRIR